MERMQSEWENRVAHNLSESGVHPMTVEELLDPAERDEVLRERLVYVQSNGSDALRAAIAALYPGAEARNVVVTNGTAEANYISVWRLVEPGDEVVMMLPNYMQIWGVVRSQGATVVPWPLREENGWAPDLGRAVPGAHAAHAAGGRVQPQQPHRLRPVARRHARDRGPRRHARRLAPGRRGVPRRGARGGRDPDLLGPLRAAARDLRPEQGLRPARAAHRMGGRSRGHRGRAVGTQGLPDHQPRRAVRRPRPQGAASRRARPDPGPHPRRPARELSRRRGVGARPRRGPAPGAPARPAPSPTRATPGP